MQGTVPISACCSTNYTGGSPLLFSLDLVFCGVLSTSEEWCSLGKCVTKVRKILKVFSCFPPGNSVTCMLEEFESLMKSKVDYNYKPHKGF